MRYNRKFYQINKNFAINSARRVIPIVMEMVKPKSVIDVGCGLGEWLSVFRQNEVADILGLDGKWVERKNLAIPNDKFISVNLEEPIAVERKFDLAISLEVAEHIDKSKADVFVRSLTKLAPVILFSAAIPFQHGTGHKNEQWPSYWAKLFRRYGYYMADCLRPQIWNDKNVVYWYSQNLFLVIKKSYWQENKDIQRKVGQLTESPLPIVHPQLYDTIAPTCWLLNWIFPVHIRGLINKLGKTLHR